MIKAARRTKIVLAAIIAILMFGSSIAGTLISCRCAVACTVPTSHAKPVHLKADSKPMCACCLKQRAGLKANSTLACPQRCCHCLSKLASTDQTLTALIPAPSEIPAAVPVHFSAVVVDKEQPLRIPFLPPKIPFDTAHRSDNGRAPPLS